MSLGLQQQVQDVLERRLTEASRAIDEERLQVHGIFPLPLDKKFAAPEARLSREKHEVPEGRAPRRRRWEGHRCLRGGSPFAARIGSSPKRAISTERSRVMSASSCFRADE